MTAQERADITANMNSTSFAMKLPPSTSPTMLVSPSHSVSMIQGIIKVTDVAPKYLQLGKLYSTILTPGSFVAAISDWPLFTKTHYCKL